MPTIYLSPSTQQANPYITGGTEEYYMNRLADAMVPYLRSSGIQYTRNTPDMTAASSIRASNAGNYDVHLALHSNAAPDALSGQIRGTDVYFYPGSTSGRRLADLLVDNLKQVYPNPAKVRAVPTTSLGEVSRTRAPGVLIEYAYHDNVEDANWIKNNLDSIARATVRALTEYFGIPFVEPQPAQEARVNVSSGYLNIRSKPSTNSTVLARAYDGDPITILGEWQGWDVVNYRGTVGYAASQYIEPVG